MSEYYVCNADEIPDRGRRVVQCGEHEIGIFRLGEELVAWHNRCAHRGGPVCQGRIFNRVLEPVAADGTIRMMEYDADTPHIVCPWHGYEFDLRTGEHPGAPGKRLRRAEIILIGNEVHVRP